MSDRQRRSDGPAVESLQAMYAALGQPAFDEHLHPEITLWEPDRPGPLFGRQELDRLRAARRASGGIPPDLRLVLEDVVVDQWDDQVAVVRYRLTDANDRREGSRCTDVLTNDEGGWRIVHRHSSDEPAPSTPGQELR